MSDYKVTGIGVVSVTEKGKKEIMKKILSECPIDTGCSTHDNNQTIIVIKSGRKLTS